jgi:hypothetical protein
MKNDKDHNNIRYTNILKQGYETERIKPPCVFLPGGPGVDATYFLPLLKLLTVSKYAGSI